MINRRALALVCLFALFGFGHENVMAGVLPLVVFDRGGDAAVVGVLVAAYGIPTIVLRPLIGRILDGPRRPTVVRGGAALLSVAPLGFLLPSVATMVATRIVQGVGWSAYGTSGHAILARVAPAGRRSEAAGYYNAMPSLAILIGPALGLWLYANVASAAPFVLAASLGFAGLLLTVLMPITVPTRDPTAPPRPPVKLVVGIFDPAAVIPMLLIGTYMSVQSLFVIFAPVYAKEFDIPIAQLGIYYPVYGVIVLFAHLSLGRVSDRFGRWPAIAAGCVIALAGLAVAVLAPGLVGLIAAGSLYGIATSLISSTVSAITMETAPPDRTGSAMATYSVGYQLGASMGGAAWGTLIAVAGYPWPFVGGAAMIMLALLIGAFRLRPVLERANAGA
jgi:MFS family permease